MDCNILEHLEQARRHIALSERHIARQREIITELIRGGYDPFHSRQLLASFEELQRLHIAELDRIETELANTSE
jgi:hypothetical protein